MTKKIVFNIMQLSKAMAAMTSVAIALCHATEDELKLSNVSADYFGWSVSTSKRNEYSRRHDI